MREREPSPCGWALISDPDEVLPFNDVGVHTRGMSCACRPDLSDEDYIVHNAWDRREDYVERGRKVH